MEKGDLLRRIMSGVMLVLLMLCVLAYVFNIKPVNASGIIYIRADGSIEPPTAPISTADNITYIFTDNISDSEGIVIQRSNIIVDGDGYTLQGTGAEVYPYQGIYVNPPNVTIKNLNIANFYYAIDLILTVNSVISGNNLTNNTYGIRLDAASENTLSENHIIGTKNYGIYLFNSANDNTISDNNITETYYGLTLQDSSNNVFRRNRMANNTGSFYVWGDNLSDFLNDIDTTNTVDEKPIYYWVNKTGLSVPSDAGYVALVNCKETTVANLNLTAKNSEGILLAYSSNSTAVNNRIANTSLRGIRLVDSSNNNISRNNLTNCGIAGIDLRNSFFNRICSNELVRTSYHLTFAFVLGSSSFNNISENTIGGLAVGVGFSIFENSENNTILSNSIDLEGDGFILMNSNKNTISRNNVLKEHTNNPMDRYCGAYLRNSSSNTIFGNDIANKEYGIRLSESTNNSIVENSISNSTIYGIWFESSRDNKIYHNTFTKSALQVNATAWHANTWDDGYPSGGNYWSDYAGTDLFRGIYQNETRSDGVGDSPYFINADNQDYYPLMKPYAGTNDVGIANISKLKTVICQGYSFNKTVKVINYGMQSETFDFIVKVNTTIIESHIMTLSSRDSTDIAWNTYGYAKGNYTIWAYASPVTNETYTADNTFTCWIIVSMVGDITSEATGYPDGRCDMSDLYPICKLFGVIYPDSRYKPNCDIDGDMRIDMSDIYIAAKNFGKIDP